MKCELSACYFWKKNKVRHLEFGKVEVDLSKEEMIRLQEDPQARVLLFKERMGCGIDEILGNGVQLKMLPA